MALTEIDTIEHLILLDLLGAANPETLSFFNDTAWLYDGLISAEGRLAKVGAFAHGDEGGIRWKSFFRPRREDNSNPEYIPDDHVPFLRKGVSILHIIPVPIPWVWHSLLVCALLYLP